jgi:hypothetical protein
MFLGFTTGADAASLVGSERLFAKGLAATSTAADRKLASSVVSVGGGSTVTAAAASGCSTPAT